MKNVSQIHQWAESEKIRKLLKEKFAIGRIPYYYWLLSLLKIVKPESLNQCLKQWTTSLLPEDPTGLTISVDGTTVCSTKRMKNCQQPLHIISTQLSKLGLTVASKSVCGKSNEIPTVQSLLEELDISGCLVVADALNCQKETAKTMTEGNGDYLRVANQTIQENINLLRKFSLNMIRQFKDRTSSKRSVSKIMFDCLLGPVTIIREPLIKSEISSGKEVW